MVTFLKFEIASLVAIAGLHLVVGAVHHFAHVLADVENTPLELLFIVVIVTIVPWATIYVAWKKTLKIGAALFSLSMAASLVFGLVLHFGIDGPDLHSNVVPAHSAIFLYSALGLALVEFAGCVCGLRLCIRCRTSWR